MNPDGTFQELIREFVGLLTAIEVSPDGLSLVLEIMDLADYATDLFHLEINTGAVHPIAAWDGSDHIGSWRRG
jgi:hypothetical protein